MRTEGFEPKSGVRMLERQDGQALVEFALIVPISLMIVVGIIYFGIGLNYWLDMNRTANKEARQAVVNHWARPSARGVHRPVRTPTSRLCVAPSWRRTRGRACKTSCGARRGTTRR